MTDKKTDIDIDIEELNELRRKYEVSFGDLIVTCKILQGVPGVSVTEKAGATMVVSPRARGLKPKGIAHHNSETSAVVEFEGKTYQVNVYVTSKVFEVVSDGAIAERLSKEQLGEEEEIKSTGAVKDDPRWKESNAGKRSDLYSF